MSTPAQDLIFLANRLHDANAGSLTFQLESQRVVRVSSYSDNHRAAQAYIHDLPGEPEWTEPVVLEDGSSWRQVSVTIHGVEFYASHCQPAAQVLEAA